MMISKLLFSVAVSIQLLSLNLAHGTTQAEKGRSNRAGDTYERRVKKWDNNKLVNKYFSEAETPLSCKFNSLFGWVVKAGLESKSILPHMKWWTRRYCAENMIHSDSNREKSATIDIYRGPILKTLHGPIILGGDVYSDFKTLNKRTNKVKLNDFLIVASSLYHELTHLVFFTHHGDGNDEETWTAAWGDCFAFLALKQFIANHPDLVDHKSPEKFLRGAKGAYCDPSSLRTRPGKYLLPTWWDSNEFIRQNL